MMKGMALSKKTYLVLFIVLALSAVFFLFTKSQAYIVARALECTIRNIDDVHLNNVDDDSIYRKSRSEFIEYAAPIAMKSCEKDIDAVMVSAIQKAGFEKHEISEEKYNEIYRVIEGQFVEELKTLYYED